MSFILFIIFVVIIGIVANNIAKRKKRSAGAWTFFCMLMPILVLVLLCLPLLDSEIDKEKAKVLTRQYIDRYTKRESVYRSNEVLSKLYARLSIGKTAHLAELQSALELMDLFDD